MIPNYAKGFMILSDEQKDMFDICMAHSLGMTNTQVLKVRASAGTGKTFVANQVVSVLNSFGIPSTKVSFTARAAMRIGGITLHTILYTPVLDKNGDLVRWEKKTPSEIREGCGNVIIADEWSMNNREITTALLQIGLPIIAIGDDHQLEPVETNGIPFNPFDEINGLEVSLRDMRRFNPDSGIARLGEALRDENVIKKIRSDDVRYVSKALIKSPKFYEKYEFDIIACGTNKTRKAINDAYRIADGVHDDLPSISEKVMCLRNDVVGGQKISNGEIFKTIFVGHGAETSRLVVQSLDDPDKEVTVDVLHSCWAEEYSPRKHKGSKVCAFGFGNAATVHKLQGSTFDKVLYVDENVSYFTDQRKFRYTGITRAAKHVTIAI